MVARVWAGRASQDSGRGGRAMHAVPEVFFSSRKLRVRTSYLDSQGILPPSHVVLLASHPPTVPTTSIAVELKAYDCFVILRPAC